MYLNNIDKDDIKKLPLKSFGGRIILVDGMKDFARYIEVIEKETIWGFDTETRPAFRRGVTNKPALMQLANSAYVFLFRLNYLGIPDRLVRVLNNPSVKKIGVALHDDLKDLALYRSLKPDGFVDLQKIVGEYGIESRGLTKLTAIILKFRISKSQRITNWENHELTDAQIRYAATDAWVCHEIYHELMRHNTRP
jgi:ribonuclease D